MIQTGFALDFQAKATTDWTLRDEHIVYDLEAKNFNDMALRTAAETTLILILLCLPKSRVDWHGTSLTETILRHCCYWYVVDDKPTENVSGKTIYIPTKNLLTPKSLLDLMELEGARRRGQST